MLKLGSHVGMSGKEMLLGSAKEAVSYGANTFMFYTGAPQNTRRKEISELNIEPAWEYMKDLKGQIISKIPNYCSSIGISPLISNTNISWMMKRIDSDYRRVS